MCAPGSCSRLADDPRLRLGEERDTGSWRGLRVLGCSPEETIHRQQRRRRRAGKGPSGDGHLRREAGPPACLPKAVSELFSQRKVLTSTFFQWIDTTLFLGTKSAPPSSPPPPGRGRVATRTSSGTERRFGERAPPPGARRALTCSCRKHLPESPHPLPAYRPREAPSQVTLRGGAAQTWPWRNHLADS